MPPKKTKKTKLEATLPTVDLSLKEREPLVVRREPAGLAVSVYKKIALTFAVLTGLLTLLVVYFALTKAVILVTSAREELRADFFVAVESQPGRPEAVKGRVVVKEVQGTKSFLVGNGGTKVPVPVTGKVVLKNVTSRGQMLVVKTRLLSVDGVLFRLRRPALVPAGGEVSAEVYADKPGPEAAIAPGRFSIPGLPLPLQSKIYGESTEHFTGGLASISVITEEAASSAAEELGQSLFNEAVAALKKDADVSAGFTGEAFGRKMIQRTVSPKLGAVAAGGEVAVTLKIKVVFFDRDKVLALGRAHLAEQLRPDRVLSKVFDDRLNVSVEAVDEQKGNAQLRVILTGASSLSSSSPLLAKEKFAGRDVSTVKSELLSSEAVDEVEINLRPFWARKIPVLKDHVEVVIKEE